MILVRRFTFLVEKSWKNVYFHPILAWPPATYEVISRKHSNWPSLNVSQNVRGGWTNSYWKRQVLMFYPLRKDSEKGYGGGHSPPPPLYVRGLIFNHSYLDPSKVPVSVPLGFPAVSVWRGVYSVRHSSNSCCHLLIGLFSILAMFGESGPDIFFFS